MSSSKRVAVSRLARFWPERPTALSGFVVTHNSNVANKEFTLTLEESSLRREDGSGIKVPSNLSVVHRNHARPSPLVPRDPPKGRVERCLAADVWYDELKGTGASALTLLWTVLVLACPPTLPAQETPADAASTANEAIHDELRAMREALTQAVLEGNADGQLAHVHDDVVVTWQNNQVVRKASGLKEFLGEMNSGDDRVFQGYTVPPTADELTILHGGDTGIAFGTSTPHYNYMGMEFDLENRWTATLVKDADQWKLAGYHVSGNIMDNPVLTVAKRSVYWVGGVCLLIGLVLGMLLAKLSGKRGA